MSNKIIIAGHSHTAALVGPSGDRDNVCLLPVTGYDRIFGLHGPLTAEGYPIRTDDYWSMLARYAPGNSIALLYAGNEQNWNFLFEVSTRFDFVLHRRPSLPLETDAVIVPETLVRTELHHLVGSALGHVLTYLKAQPDSRVAVVGPPPPKGDHERLKRLIPPEYPDLVLTPALMRLKLWHVLQEIYQEEAMIHDAEFISPPDTVKDETGFLRPEFWAPDLTHANEDYGRLMLSRLAQQL